MRRQSGLRPGSAAKEHGEEAEGGDAGEILRTAEAEQDEETKGGEEGELQRQSRKKSESDEDEADFEKLKYGKKKIEKKAL